MRKRYTVRAIEERMVEVTLEAESPVDAILKAEEHGTKWKATGERFADYEPSVRYIIKSSRPEGA